MSQEKSVRKCPFCGKELREGTYPSLWNEKENKVVLVWHREHENDEYKDELNKRIAKIYGKR
jgi:tRNA(Phe) wybutosine-synthesizing methylase Tyw3